MKTTKKHITAWVLLILLNVYVSPFQYFHSCHRQAHHAHSAVIEESHTECYLCDIEFQSFQESENFDIKKTSPFYISSVSKEIISYKSSFFSNFFNKGPPVNAIQIV